MSLANMLSEMSVEMMNDHMERIINDPQKYDKILKMALKGTELGIVFLRESKEFREAFARIHAEFLKYPESKEVISESINAYTKYAR